MAKFGKFVWEWAKFGITNTIDGLYKLLSDDSSWMDRIVGFGQAFLGFASIFIGMKGIAWLLNPVKVVKGISNAIKALIKFAGNRGLPNLNPFKRKETLKGSRWDSYRCINNNGTYGNDATNGKRWMD